MAQNMSASLTRCTKVRSSRINILWNAPKRERILASDAATATRDCAALRAFLAAAKTTSTAHEKATGFPNDALVAYIQASQHEAGCPAASD